MSISTFDLEYFTRNFNDPVAVARYAEGAARFVPGFDALHRMAGLLLAEHASEDARILVLGAGGGLELRALAAVYPHWTFVGVDPASQMLRLAERTLADGVARVELIEGYIDDAPVGPFDGAVCLLTLHFLKPDDRRATIAAIHRRLRPGAPFIAAHGSFPQTSDERGQWLDRYVAYAVASGADHQMALAASEAIEACGMMLDPDHDLALLREGGFADATLFFAAFTWRGWVGHA